MTTLHKINDLLERWSRPVTESERSAVKRGLLSDESDRILGKLLEVYLEEIDSQTPWLRESPVAVASGGLAWIGAYLLALSYQDQLERAPVEDILGIIMVYVLVDFMIDAPDTPELMVVVKELKTSIAELELGVEQYRALVPVDRSVRAVQMYVLRLLERTPGCYNAVIDAWRAEAASMKQKTSTDIDEVLSIVRLKGATTTLLVHAVLEFKTPGAHAEEFYKIGEVTQLVDDLADSSLDIADGISTGATLYAARGEYDRYLLLCLEETVGLVDQLISMAHFMTIVTIGATSELGSDETREVFKRFSCVDQDVNIIDRFIRITSK